MLSEANCPQEANNTEFDTIEGYVEKMIAWKIRFKNLMENDPSDRRTIIAWSHQLPHLCVFQRSSFNSFPES
ncbi:hypothetical protein TNCT_668861 [Trichonephila clavata]|uniref:Uncharacterized protein n=1 Tax=Trichonephila clavata TaxID=2740835 RepID=A0A8X6LEZ9_TRICU|nr:hypothetical protein TNCT_668861 [Trichonephila clavata]